MRLSLAALGIALVVEPATGMPGPADVGSKPRHVPGQVLVRMEAGYGPATRPGMSERMGVQGARHVTGRVAALRLRTGESVAAAVKRLRGYAGVHSVQPNYLYLPSAVPDEEQSGRYPEQWALDNDGQSVDGVTGSPGADIDAERAWNQRSDCSAVTVAVVDTGVNYTHDDLDDNMWQSGDPALPNHGRDFVGIETGEDDNDPMPTDGSGHGTHVAAIIGAEGDNGMGTVGVCWNARIMALRALSLGRGGTTAAVAASIDFAVDHGAEVINLSLGGTGFDPILKDAIERAGDNGAVVVTAAGNEGIDLDAPGNDLFPCEFDSPNLVCVTALDQSFILPGFANRGTSSVDLGGPGVNILQSWPGEPLGPSYLSWTTNNGDWAARCLDSTGHPVMTNPADWCNTTAGYDTGADTTWRSFDLARDDPIGVGLEVGALIDVEEGADFYRIGVDAGGGDPFDGSGSEDTLHEFTGETGETGKIFTHELTSFCLGDADCAIGFELDADVIDTTDRGVAVPLFRVLRTIRDTAAMDILDGTSMATPHAAGVAALVFAHNPEYTASDVVSALKSGGEPVEALEGLTVTGNAVNAMGSLAHIRTPTGVTASVR